MDKAKESPMPPSSSSSQNPQGGIDRIAAAKAIESFLRALGHDPTGNAELQNTGHRVAEAWAEEFLDGYAIDPAELLRAESLPTPADCESTLVVLHESETSTMCPHHLLPALGTATIAYVPGERLVGLGTLARLVDAFAHRLVLQEQIGVGVAAALMHSLGAKGALCHMRMRHSCLSARGERKGGAWVETLAMKGELSPGGPYAAALPSILNNAMVNQHTGFYQSSSAIPNTDPTDNPNTDCKPRRLAPCP